MRYDLLAVLAKIETTYGVDPVPTALANATLWQAVELTPMEADQVARPRVRTYDAASEKRLTAKRALVQGNIDAAGSGTAGTAPAYGQLLRACGLAEVITPGTKVEYAPISAGFESLAAYFYMDTALHKLTGARGALTFNATAKALPYFRPALTGLFQPVVAGSLPAPTVTAWKEPVVVDKDNTTFSWAGTSLPVKSFAFEMGSKVVHRELIGKREVRILGREPKLTVQLEAPELGSLNFFDLAAAHAKGTVTFTHGVTAGNILGFSAAAAQPLNPSYVNDDGVALLQIEFTLTPVNGNVEFKFTLT